MRLSPTTNHFSGVAATMAKVPAEDLFLDQEERYEVFTVKAAERPHLVAYQEEQPHLPTQTAQDTALECGVHVATTKTDNNEAGGHDEEKKEDGELSGQTYNQLPPPLVDGCDLPGWRCHRLAYDASSNEIEGMLNIGVGSTLFRRADQLSYPCRLSRSSEFQTKLVDRLTVTPPSPEVDAEVVDYEECSQCVDASTVDDNPLKATRFAIDYEQRNVPAKIVGATKKWPAMPTENNKGWAFENLVERFGNVMWRFSDVHGEMLTLQTYNKYISTVEGQTDDSPLAIYDAEFGDEDSPTSALLDEYEVPTCFSPDLFDLAIPSGVDNGDDDDDDDGDARPPYRWILIGPERSGTGLHVDPLWTNAWVTVLQGLKRWLLFPPCTPQEEIGMIEGEPQISSSIWFRDYYDKVMSPDWPKEWRPVEVLQHPGETVFVPNGWPHLVLNLKLTTAVTHNYASEFGFERMWREVATDEPQFAKRWYAGMLLHRPDLAKRVQVYHGKAVIDEEEWALEYGGIV